jgi:hypothetical protein
MRGQRAQVDGAGLGLERVGDVGGEGGGEVEGDGGRVGGVLAAGLDLFREGGAGGRT